MGRKKLTRKERKQIKRVIELLDEAVGKVGEMYEELVRIDRLINNDVDEVMFQIGGEIYDKLLAEWTVADSAVVVARRELGGLATALRKLRSLFEEVVKD